MDFGRIFRKKSSRDIAKDRLKILLISDRVNCSPEMMEMIKTDIAKVISKYMKIDTDRNDRKKRESKAEARHRPFMQAFPLLT